MWDEMHTQPIFEIGQTVTNETGFFDTSLVDFLKALPGENEISAKFDWARVVSRRAERKCVRWQRHLEIDDSDEVVFLNRLSDLLWMLAREFESDWTPSK